MKLEEYIEDDLPFYHITHFGNKENIFEHGLKRMSNIQGICVTRSSDTRVINLIAVGQLVSGNNPEERYCIFKLLPSKHNIEVKDIRKDITGESTNALNNYIRKDVIPVDMDDIFIDDITITVNNIPYFKPIIDELIAEGLM